MSVKGMVTIMRINVHAGHNPDGMIAHGAVGYVKESTENRVVVAEVIRQLEALGHTVYDCTVNNGTSQSDVLRKIVVKCNQQEVDLDISVHFNAFMRETTANGQTKGTEVLVYNVNGAASSYAQKITEEIAKLGYRNRGLKENKNLYVLRKSKAPAMLIECCFVDDVDDVSLYHYRTMANAIVTGITGQTVEEVITPTESAVQDDIPEMGREELYRVQVGAYSVKENAMAMLQQLKEAGFDAFITQA